MTGLSIEKQEVLRYLGYAGQEMEPQLDAQINECIKECENHIRPMYVYKYFAIQEQNTFIELSNTDLRLPGKDIKAHLHGSISCAVMAATLGPSLDQYIRLNQKQSMQKAVILDACATACIEALCDKAQAEILDQYETKGSNATSRFSPGYGDLPLSLQPHIIRVLNAAKAIGLTATSSFLLVPRKSVTAIIGFGDNKVRQTTNKCEYCAAKDTCQFRKEGRKCHGTQEYKRLD